MIQVYYLRGTLKAYYIGSCGPPSCNLEAIMMVIRKDEKTLN